jgi:threonine aldolase
VVAFGVEPYTAYVQDLGQLSGVLAAAGLYALDHNLEKLPEDHANARRLGEHIQSIPGLKLMTPDIETNIVFFDVSGAGLTSRQVYDQLIAQGVRMGVSYGGMIRAVTHLDVSRDDIDAAGTALRDAVASLKSVADQSRATAATA